MRITTKQYARIMHLFAVLLLMLVHPVWAETNKPNILVIWGDDIGQFNISAYNRGMMGYRTPNIDSRQLARPAQPVRGARSEGSKHFHFLERQLRRLIG